MADVFAALAAFIAAVAAVISALKANDASGGLTTLRLDAAETSKAVSSIQAQLLRIEQRIQVQQGQGQRSAITQAQSIQALSISKFQRVLSPRGLGLPSLSKQLYWARLRFSGRNCPWRRFRRRLILDRKIENWLRLHP